MKNLLVVDDDKSVLSIITLALEDHFEGIRVITVENGKMAAAVLDGQDIDLVLTDLQMPVMDGFALAEYRGKNHPYVPAIAMSGDLSAEAVNRLAALGVSQYLAKPFSLKTLISKISATLPLKAKSPLVPERSWETMPAGRR